MMIYHRSGNVEVPFFSSHSDRTKNQNSMPVSDVLYFDLTSTFANNVCWTSHKPLGLNLFYNCLSSDGFIFMDSVASVWSEMFCLTNVLFEHQPPAHRQQFRQGVVKKFQMYKWVGWVRLKRKFTQVMSLHRYQSQVCWLDVDFFAKWKTQYPNDAVQHFQWVQVSDICPQKSTKGWV